MGHVQNKEENPLLSLYLLISGLTDPTLNQYSLETRKKTEIHMLNNNPGLTPALSCIVSTEITLIFVRSISSHTFFDDDLGFTTLIHR